MYTKTSFEDRNFMACSVPPPVNERLDEGFSELSRIHFYLGNVPIDFMIESVEKASLEDIERGKIPIYFAVKEIQDFLQASYNRVLVSSKDKLEPNLYFDQAFKDILSHCVEVLELVYKKPTKKRNLAAIETMLKLTHEVKYLKENLSIAGINTLDITQYLEDIEQKYQKIYKLKDNYENLSALQDFHSFETIAKESVIEQLKQPYDFNYDQLTKIYMKNDNWVYVLNNILEEQKEINTDVNYPFKKEESKKLKENFLKQIKSFNRLLQNGVINYVLSSSAALSTEIFFHVKKSIVSPEAYYEREIGYHEKQQKSLYLRDSYHEEKLKDLKQGKAKFIQDKKDDKHFYENHLTLLSRQEQNIIQSLEKLRVNILNNTSKPIFTLEGDINKGFVIGKFSNSDKIILVHKDDLTETYGAIYALQLSQTNYDKLNKDNNLVYTKKLRYSKLVETGSNFYNYGQFLQEMSYSEIQCKFLGQEYILVDKTNVIELKKKSQRL